MKTPSYILSPLAPTQVTGDRDTSQRHLMSAIAIKKAEERDVMLVMGQWLCVLSESYQNEVFPRRDSNPGLAGESRVS